MPHVFFEKLENRRNTQALYTGFPNYGTAIAYYGVSIPDLNPTSNTGSIFPWGSGWGTAGYQPFVPSISFPYNDANSASSPWSNSFFQPSNTWMNPFSNLFTGIGNFFSPIFNNFQGFRSWQPMPLPLYPSQNYMPPFSNEFRLLYGVSLSPYNPTAYTPPSYRPPFSGMMPLYGITAPTSISPVDQLPRALYGISLPTSFTNGY